MSEYSAGLADLQDEARRIGRLIFYLVMKKVSKTKSSRRVKIYTVFQEGSELREVFVPDLGEYSPTLGYLFRGATGGDLGYHIANKIKVIVCPDSVVGIRYKWL